MKVSNSSKSDSVHPLCVFGAAILSYQLQREQRAEYLPETPCRCSVFHQVSITKRWLEHTAQQFLQILHAVFHVLAGAGCSIILFNQKPVILHVAPIIRSNSLQ